MRWNSRIAFAACFLVLGLTSAEAAQWMYKKDADALTDRRFSFAAGFEFDYRYNNDFTLSFQCSDGKVRFEINADSLIQSKGKDFSFAYRVDKREARQLVMKTFSNEGQGGYTYTNVRQIANDFLGGGAVFVRAITWNNDYLEATVSLSGADAAIKKVFADCGVSLESASVTAQPAAAAAAYSIERFNADFQKLTPAEQRKLLDEIGELMNKRVRK